MTNKYDPFGYNQEQANRVANGQRFNALGGKKPTNYYSGMQNFLSWPELGGDPTAAPQQFQNSNSVYQPLSASNADSDTINIHAPVTSPNGNSSNQGLGSPPSRYNPAYGDQVYPDSSATSFDPNNLQGVNQDPALANVGTDPKVAPDGVGMNNWQAWGAGTKGISDLMGAWSAWEGMNLARDQFDLNKDVAKANVNNTAATVEADAIQKARARASRAGGNRDTAGAKAQKDLNLRRI